MQAARRLYLYAMSAVTLAVIGAGLATLLDVLLTGSGFMHHPYESSTGTRELLSRAIAMLGVGVPVWAVHWWLVGRSVAAGRPDREAERGSAIRAAYLTLVLLVSLLIWVNGVSDVVKWVLIPPSSLQQSYSWIDPVNAMTLAVVGFVAWTYHVFVHIRDLDAGPLRGPAAWIPRLYVYGIALGALVISLSSLESLIANLVNRTPFDEGYGQMMAVQNGVSFVVWGLVWGGHWRAAGGLTGMDDWRGQEERVARTRTAAFIATIAVATAFTISAAAGAIQAVVAPGIGRVPYDSGVVGAQFVGPLVAAIAWAVAWWAHVHWLRAEPSAADPLRALHHTRLETHATAATGLGLGATGLGWVLGMGVDIAFGGERMNDPSRVPWTFELSMWLPMAILGLGIWAWQWSRVVSRSRRDAVGEANSTIRRTFLFLTLAGGLIAGIASTALILYRLVGAVIGAQLSGNAVSALSTPIGALIVAVAVLVYHGLLLRADMTRRVAPAVVAATMPLDAVPQGATRPGSTGPALLRHLELVGPEGSDADAVLAAARAALPDGFRLEERPG